MVTHYDIVAAQGSDLTLQFTVLDNNSGVLDISNYTASGWVRQKYSSTGILLNLNPVVNSSGAASGWLDVFVSGVQLRDIPVGEYVYDIQIFNTFTGFRAKAVQGYFDIEPGVTQ